MSDDDEFGDVTFLQDFDVDAAVAQASASKEAKNEAPPTMDDDEFGDASFLEGYDIDAAVARGGSASKANEDDSSPTKRLKLLSALPLADLKLSANLTKYFGFPEFRPGQEQVISAVLSEKRDVVIFWATGQGKSICYQLPALVSKQITIVISPLISLMQDQVHKLNHIFPENVSTYLGSAQLSYQEEEKALRGDYLLIYVTPEKLVSDNFLQRLSALNIGLFAFDESHCVSQWGHDFRPEYRQAGQALRAFDGLKHIPIMALTATAAPHIQQDIMQNLRLCNPLIDQQSLDRSNLKIQISVKESNAMRATMESLLSQLENTPNMSTIVYATSRALVEDLASYLQQRLQARKSKAAAEPYHAGLSHETRKRVHEGFLTGHITIVVATTSFGMGIDKPDIRSVIHFGPPKSMEEYYQQIGRAGRDGLASTCQLVYSPSDFDAYLSDFYIGKLQGKAREMAINSTKALKSFCLDSETCRRKGLLEFFGQRLGSNNCGTCDVCVKKQRYGKDVARNFVQEARYIMKGISRLKQQGMTVLLKVLNGGVVEGYRYHSLYEATQLAKQFSEQRSAFEKPNLTNDLIKEFLIALVSTGYIQEGTKQYSANGYNRSSTIYKLSSKGSVALSSSHITEIELPVPEAIRAYERQQELKRQKLLKRLAAMKLTIPEKELEQVDGPHVQAFTKWMNWLERREEKGDSTEHLKQLLEAVENWRSETAKEQKMAPAAVMAEHLVYTVSYMAASLMPGSTTDPLALIAVGVRSRTLGTLVQVINDWLKIHRAASYLAVGESDDDKPMVFPSGLIAVRKWQYSVSKTKNATASKKPRKDPVWLGSWRSFTLEGKGIQEIAMTAGKRPVQASTVQGHLLVALENGYPTDVSQLAKADLLVPTRSQWLQLEEAQDKIDMDVTGDPNTSGKEGSKYIMTDVLRPIVGDELCDLPFTERSDDQKELLMVWFQRLKWFQAIKRSGIIPQFGTVSGHLELVANVSEFACEEPSKLQIQSLVGDRPCLVPSISTTRLSVASAVLSNSTNVQTADQSATTVYSVEKTIAAASLPASQKMKEV